MAIDEQIDSLGYKQRYRLWKKGDDEQGTTNPRTIHIEEDATWTAVFLKEFDITFRNQFVGASGYHGEIKVNGDAKNSPHEEKVLETYEVTGQAFWQVYDGIEYNFSQWSDGYQYSTRTFEPEVHGIYTAEYTGKPRSMKYYNLHTNDTPGEYVTLYWNEHPNEEVEQYRIWRKVKDSISGEEYGPDLVAICSHGTTTWVDYAFTIISRCVEDLVSYDVRARWYVDQYTYYDV